MGDLARRMMDLLKHTVCLMLNSVLPFANASSCIGLVRDVALSEFIYDLVDLLEIALTGAWSVDSDMVFAFIEDPSRFDVEAV